MLLHFTCCVARHFHGSCTLTQSQKTLVPLCLSRCHMHDRKPHDPEPARPLFVPIDLTSWHGKTGVRINKNVMYSCRNVKRPKPGPVHEECDAPRGVPRAAGFRFHCATMQLCCAANATVAATVLSPSSRVHIVPLPKENSNPAPTTAPEQSYSQASCILSKPNYELHCIHHAQVS